MVKRKTLIYALLMVLLAAAISDGCTAQRKPLNPYAPSPIPPAPSPQQSGGLTAPTIPPNQATTPSTTGNPALGISLANMMSTIPGVTSARVVITGTTGKTAYVALKRTTPSGKNGDGLGAAKQQALDVIRRNTAGVSTVYIATDARSFSELVVISDGVSRGIPYATYSRQLGDIRARIPATRIETTAKR